MEFDYGTDINIRFGIGSIKSLGKEAICYGRNALLVCGRNSVSKSGILEKIKAQFGEMGLNYVVYDEIGPNPTFSMVYKGAELSRKHACDVVIGIGGGSVMDAAKAIAFGAINQEPMEKYIFGEISGEAALPIILVPTTCGTGSEGNCFSVLSDERTKDKKALKNKLIYPAVSIVDPELMMTLPKRILASVGFDALSHCIEAYIANNSTDKSSEVAFKGIELLSSGVVDLYESAKTDLELWEKVTLGSTYGGIAIDMAGVTAPHALEHPLSGLRNISHGEGLAALYPEIMKRTAYSGQEKLIKMLENIVGTGTGKLDVAIGHYLERLHLGGSLSKLGFRSEDLEWLTENALKVSAAGLKNHPQQFERMEIYEIYSRCL